MSRMTGIRIPPKDMASSCSFSGFVEGIQERLSAFGISFEDITGALGAVWDGFCSLLAPVFEGAFGAA